MEAVSGCGESISHKASDSDHQEMVRVMVGPLMAFLKTSPKFSGGRAAVAAAKAAAALRGSALPEPNAAYKVGLR